MTSPKLQMIARQLNLKPKQERVQPTDTSGLGAALEQMIQQAVEERVKEALAQREQHSPRVQRLMDQFNAPPMPTDYKQLPPIQKTAPAKNLTAQLFRDGAGVTRWVQIGDLKFEAQRDGAGRLIGMRQVDESPILPQPEIPFKTEAREYKPDTPR